MDLPLCATLPFRMSKNITIPVRLDPEQAAAIKRYATRFAVTEAQIIRWAIDAFLRYVELHQGDLRLPLDFSHFWPIAERHIEATRLNEAAGTSPELRPARLPEPDKASPRLKRG